MSKRIKVLIIIILLICVSAIILLLQTRKTEPAAFECRDLIGCVTIAPGESVKIGVIQDLSGGASVFGRVQLNSINLALEHRSRRVLGRPIELQIEDEICSEEGGKNSVFKILSDPQVVAILGTTCSGAAASASKIMSEAGLVMISGVNSAPGLTSIRGDRGSDQYPGYFRISSNDSLRGSAAAKFAIEELGITRAATIDDGDAYTRGSTEIFSRDFTRLGGEIVLNARIDKGDTDMKPVLTSVVNSRAELLYFPLFAGEGVQIVRQMNEMDELKDIKKICASPMLVESVIASMGSDAAGMYGTASTIPEGPDYEELIKNYKGRYGEKPASSGASAAYDSVNILLDAIEKISVIDEDGTIYIGRQELRDTLYSTKNYKGTTGILSCDQFGDCGLSTIKIERFDSSPDDENKIELKVVYEYGSQ